MAALIMTVVSWDFSCAFLALLEAEMRSSASSRKRGSWERGLRPAVRILTNTALSEKPRRNRRGASENPAAASSAPGRSFEFLWLPG